MMTMSNIDVDVFAVDVGVGVDASLTTDDSDDYYYCNASFLPCSLKFLPVPFTSSSFVFRVPQLGFKYCFYSYHLVLYCTSWLLPPLSKCGTRLEAINRLCLLLLSSLMSLLCTLGCCIFLCVRVFKWGYFKS